MLFVLDDLLVEVIFDLWYFFFEIVSIELDCFVVVRIRNKFLIFFDLCNLY